MNTIRDINTTAKNTPEGPARRAGSDGAFEDRLRLVVRDLTVSCHIGVHEGEKDKAQRLRINLELEVVPPSAYDDDFSQVVDYGGAVRDIRAAVEENNSRLLETLADRILNRCMGSDMVLRARVRIEKLDRYADLGGLGVELERSRRAE